MTTYSTLIAPEALQSLLTDRAQTPNDPLLFDCRTRLGEPDWGAQAFADGHIRSARHLDLDRHLAEAPGVGGRHPLPDAATLAAHLQSEGLDADQQVVVYDDAGGAFAARAWWCLRWLGHGAVAVLDGGLPAYLALPDVELALGPSQPVTAGSFARGTPLTHQVDADAVLALIQQPSPNTALLDARTEARYAGAEEPIDPVAGHIPSAICRPFSANLNSSGRFKDPQTLRAELAMLPNQLICYCGSGVTAAHNILALVHAGLPEPALYPGSWSGWITDPSRPVATENQ